MLFSLSGAITSSLVTTEESCKCEAIAALQDSVTSRLEALSTKYILFLTMIFCMQLFTAILEVAVLI